MDDWKLKTRPVVWMKKASKRNNWPAGTDPQLCVVGLQLLGAPWKLTQSIHFRVEALDMSL